MAGSIFTFSLTLGDYITPTLVSSTQFIGNVVYANVGVANNLPLAAAFATVPVIVMIVYLTAGQAARRLRQPLMVESRLARFGLRVATAATLAFIYLPLFVILALRVQRAADADLADPGLTLDWFGKAFDNPGVREALLTSLKAALGRDGDRARARRRSPRSPCSATGSSGARRSRSSSSSRSPCPAS